ncbi:hypothetical protein ABZ721_40245, partial [Streptomyces sp. NPDC006733]
VVPATGAVQVRVRLDGGEERRAVTVCGLSGPDNPPTGQSTPDNAAGPWLAPRTVPDRQPVVAVALSQPFGGDSQALASHAQRAIALVASFGVVGRQRRADELVAAAKLGRLIPPDTLARCIRELRRQGAGVPARWVLITTGWYADPDQLAAAVAALRAAGQQADARTVLFAAGQHRSPYALSQITGQLPHDDIQILLEVASKYRSPTSVLDCLRDFSATGQYTCGRLLAESVGHLRRDEDLPAILDGLHHLHMTAAETWVLQAVARRPAPLRARAHKTLIAAGHSHHVGVLQALQQADAARTPPGTPPDGTAPHRAGAHRAAIASTAPTPPDPAARPLPEPDTGDRPLMDWGFALALIVLGVGLAVVLGLLIWVISM